MADGSHFSTLPFVLGDMHVFLNCLAALCLIPKESCTSGKSFFCNSTCSDSCRFSWWVVVLALDLSQREGCTANTGLQMFLKVAASTFWVLPFSQQLDQYGEEIWGWGIPIFDWNLPWLWSWDFHMQGNHRKKPLYICFNPPTYLELINFACVSLPFLGFRMGSCTRWHTSKICTVLPTTAQCGVVSEYLVNCWNTHAKALSNDAWNPLKSLAMSLVFGLV